MATKEYREVLDVIVIACIGDNKRVQRCQIVIIRTRLVATKEYKEVLDVIVITCMIIIILKLKKTQLRKATNGWLHS